MQSYKVISFVVSEDCTTIIDKLWARINWSSAIIKLEHPQSWIWSLYQPLNQLWFTYTFLDTVALLSR